MRGYPVETVARLSVVWQDSAACLVLKLLVICALCMQVLLRLRSAWLTTDSALKI